MIMAEEQKPTVGRVVHYTSYGTPGGEYASVCRAAIVVAVPAVTGLVLPGGAQALDLCVLNPTGMFFNTCRQDEGSEYYVNDDHVLEPPKGGTWHWPERT